MTSFETANESREYERTSTTVLNAYIIPKLKAHLAQLKKELAARGYNGSLYIMQSNGGIVKDEVAFGKSSTDLCVRAGWWSYRCPCIRQGQSDRRRYGRNQL